MLLFSYCLVLQYWASDIEKLIKHFLRFRPALHGSNFRSMYGQVGSTDVDLQKCLPLAIAGSADCCILNMSEYYLIPQQE